MRPSRIVIAVFVVIFLIYLANRPSNSIRIGTIESAQPAFKLVNRIFHGIKSYLISKKTKSDQKQRFEAKVKILEARLAKFDEIYRENERLRGLLNFRSRITYQTIPAQVIARDPSNWTNLIYIDKGADDGLLTDMGVIANEGVVGKIIETDSSVAKVMLINDPDSRIAATVQRSREEGLVCGTLSRRCRMTYISSDADVGIGDVVVTSGSGKTFSDGLLIGKIVDIFEEKGGLYKSAIIKPSANLRKLREVLCIK